MQQLARIKQFYALPWPQKQALLLALLLLPLTALALRCFSFKRCYASLNTLAQRSNSARLSLSQAQQYAHQLGRSISLAGRYGFATGNCLSQSLALWYLLQRKGIHSELRIGVANHPETTFAAHAWVEFQDQALNDSPSVYQRFSAFDQIPDTYSGSKM